MQTRNAAGIGERSSKTPFPPLYLLHAAMLLSGFATVFLGTALPRLAESTHATDSASGLFFTAQFIGAFLGGITVHRRLLFCLRRGLATAGAGFALLAACVHWNTIAAFDCACLALLGFGAGQMLVSANLLTAQRATKEQTKSLSLLNFTWSAGAITAPFLLSIGMQRMGLPVCLAFVAAFFWIVFALVFFGRDADESIQKQEATTQDVLPQWAFLLFAAILFFYGGVETCMSGWITTFGTRYGSGTLGTSSLSATALWTGIVIGRVATPLLRLARTKTLLVACLLAAAGCVLLLSRASGATSIVVLAVLLGLSLAEFFPLVLSSMLGAGASPRETGWIIALSGIGAAVLPWLLGVVSTRTASLRIALNVPLAGIAALLLLVVWGFYLRKLKSV